MAIPHEHLCASCKKTKFVCHNRECLPNRGDIPLCQSCFIYHANKFVPPDEIEQLKENVNRGKTL